MNKNPPDELLEVRRVVPPTFFSIFPEVLESHVLLELVSNNSVLDFCSCECFRAFSAEHSSRGEGRRVLALVRFFFTSNFRALGRTHMLLWCCGVLSCVVVCCRVLSCVVVCCRVVVVLLLCCLCVVCVLCVLCVCVVRVCCACVVCCVC